MGIFAGIEEATPSGSGNYVEPGNFIVMTNCCRKGTTRKKVPTFEVDCLILESDVASTKAGQTRLWSAKSDNDAFQGNVLAYMMAGGVDKEDVTQELAEELVGESQPFAGKLMRLTAWNKDTQAGKPFTRVKFEPLSAADEKKYAKVAAQYGAKAQAA